MATKYEMIDYKKPLSEMTQVEADYMEMETRNIAHGIAQKYTSKGPHYLLLSLFT